MDDSLEVLDFKEIEGDFAQKYFITIGIRAHDYCYFKQGIHQELYKWAVDTFGPPSTRWNWRKLDNGGQFQFHDKSDCILFRLQWIKN